eukprot:scaffold5318_cov31-Prasinocladus_malaysianus.AAC.1
MKERRRMRNWESGRMKRAGKRGKDKERRNEGMKDSGKKGDKTLKGGLKQGKTRGKGGNFWGNQGRKAKTDRSNREEAWKQETRSGGIAHVKA